jgi:hypothetical protein
MPDEGFANAFAQNATDEQIALSKAVQRPISVRVFRKWLLHRLGSQSQLGTSLQKRTE